MHKCQIFNKLSILLYRMVLIVTAVTVHLDIMEETVKQFLIDVPAHHVKMELTVL